MFEIAGGILIALVVMLVALIALMLLGGIVEGMSYAPKPPQVAPIKSDNDKDAIHDFKAVLIGFAIMAAIAIAYAVSVK
jgi:cytochrome b subunit of formate dehydrogenase